MGTPPRVGPQMGSQHPHRPHRPGSRNHSRRGGRPHVHPGRCGMSTPTFDHVLTGVDYTPADIMAAARILAGEPATNASEVARRLAAAAAKAAARQVMQDIRERVDADHTPSGKTGPRVSDTGA